MKSAAELFFSKNHSNSSCTMNIEQPRMMRMLDTQYVQIHQQITTTMLNNTPGEWISIQRPNTMAVSIGTNGIKIKSITIDRNLLNDTPYVHVLKLFSCLEKANNQKFVSGEINLYDVTNKPAMDLKFGNELLFNERELFSYPCTLGYQVQDVVYDPDVKYYLSDWNDMIQNDEYSIDCINSRGIILDTISSQKNKIFVRTKESSFKPKSAAPNSFYHQNNCIKDWIDLDGDGDVDLDFETERIDSRNEVVNEAIIWTHDAIMKNEGFEYINLKKDNHYSSEFIILHNGNYSFDSNNPLKRAILREIFYHVRGVELFFIPKSPSGYDLGLGAALCEATYIQSFLPNIPYFLLTKITIFKYGDQETNFPTLVECLERCFFF